MKNRWKRILFVEILILFVYFIVIGDVHHAKYIWGTENLQQSDRDIRTEGISLKPGVYNVSVFYEGWSEGKTIYVTSQDNNIRADRVKLNNVKGKTEFAFWVVCETSDVTFVVDANRETEAFSLKEIHIETSKQTYSRNIVVLLCLLVVINSCYYYFNKIKKQGISFLFIPLALLVLTIIITMITWKQNYAAIDFLFHVNRVEGLAKAILQGQIPVRIQPLWLNNYGYASSIFYGDLFLYFPAFLRIVGFSSAFSFGCFIIGVNLMTIISSYYCFYKITKCKELGILSAALVSFSQYRLVDLSYRGAVGEFQAFTFIPLVICGIYLILEDEVQKKEYKKYYLIAVLGFTGLIQSHLLSTLMVGIFVILICLLSYKRTFQKERFIELLRTVIVAALLNLWFLLPMLDYMRDKYFYNDGSRDNNLIQQYGINIQNLFDIIFALKQDVVPGRIGPALVFVLLGGVVWILLGYGKERRKIKGVMLCFAMAIITIFLSTDLFPYDSLKTNLLLNKFMITLQFPWRFLVLTVMLLTFVACGVLANVKELISKKYYYFIVVSFTLISILGGVQYYIIVNKEFISDEQKYYDTAGMDTFYYVSGEYVPMGTDPAYLTNTYVYNLDGNVYVADYKINGGIIEVSCNNETEAEGVITVPLLYYRGYRALDKDTKQDFVITKDDNNSLQVVIPSEYDGEMQISFHGFWYWRVAELVSILTILGVLIYDRKNKFLERKKR